MADFEQSTRLAPQGDGRFSVTLSSDWEIWGPNGGYLCALALRAAGACAEIPRPVALYVHYLRVAKFAEVTLDVRVVSRGRRAESLAVSMRQGERHIMEAMVRTARQGEGLVHNDYAAPSVPAPAALKSPQELGLAQGQRHNFWRNFEIRVVDPERFAESRGARPPRFLEWYRLQCEAGFSDPFVDAGRSALLLDTLGWPAAVTAHEAPGFIAPSLDVAVWFHGSGRDSDWVLAEAQAPRAADGHIHAVGRLFDAEGHLLASSGSALLCTPLPARA